VIGTSELRVRRNAAANDVKHYRAALAAFLRVFRLNESFVEDISLAVGEVLANAVEHASPEGESTDLELFARATGDESLTIDVYDPGNFVFRERREGRGFGLTIVRAIASDVTIDTGNGTRVSMVFSLGSRVFR
jgi:anti-sigma regulatory factor (Ser/Thr protein kinase)